MSNKRRHDKHKAYRELQHSSVKVQQSNQVRLNSGSETFAHRLAKLAVAHIGEQHNYWIASEVQVPGGSVDILLWGLPDRLTYAVECETNWVDSVREHKLETYVEKVDPIDDMLTVEVNGMPSDYHNALAYVSDEIGLEYQP